MNRTMWLTVAAATALIIVLTDGIPLAGRVWTALLMAPLPALMVLQARQLELMDELPRAAAYGSSIASLWILAVFTAGAAALAHFSVTELGFIVLPTMQLALIAAILTAGAVALLFAFHFAGVSETAVLRALLPQSFSEKLLFIAVSITAGICEEFIFRGFLQHALSAVTGSAWIALVLASGTFGVVHAYQSGAGALRAAMLGCMLGLPVVLGYGILPSVLAHAAVDVLSGLYLARWLLR